MGRKTINTYTQNLLGLTANNQLDRPMIDSENVKEQIGLQGYCDEMVLTTRSIVLIILSLKTNNTDKASRSWIGDWGAG